MMMRYINKDFVKEFMIKDQRLKNLPEQKYEDVWNKLEQEYLQAKLNNHTDIECDTRLWVSRKLIEIISNLGLLKSDSISKTYNNKLSEESNFFDQIFDQIYDEDC